LISLSTNTTTAADRLNDAREAAASAGGAEKLFQARADKNLESYVAWGHAAIAHIDVALRALHDARTALIGDMRRDEDERVLRVDALLAKVRAEREASAAAAAIPTPDAVAAELPAIYLGGVV
jgi:hypothetical protein